MKIPCLGKKQAGTILFAAAVLFCLSVVVSFASSPEHGEAVAKHWGDNFEWQRLMNFTVLIVALFFLLRKPVASVFSDRIKGIQEQLDELEKKKSAAERKLAEYNSKLSELEGEAEKIIKEYIQQGNEAQKRIIAEARSAADKLEDQAKKSISNEFTRAKEQLQAEIMEEALVKAEEIIKSKISDDDQDKLVDEYLEKVVA